jgi:hypothetical protein
MSDQSSPFDPQSLRLAVYANAFVNGCDMRFKAGLPIEPDDAVKISARAHLLAELAVVVSGKEKG